MLEKEHADWLEAQYAPQKAAYGEVLAKYPGTGKAEAYEEEQEWFEKERVLLARIENWEEETRQKLQTLLDGAYLMPFETREKAKAYLESMQKDFQAGGFFAKKKKTEEARKQRLHDFYAALKANVEAQIDWHLRPLAQEALKTLHLAGAQMLEQQAGMLKADFSEAMLAAQVKEGARLTGDYILHYCENVSDEIKRSARQAWDDWKAPVLKQAALETEEQLKMAGKRPGRQKNWQRLTGILKK